MFDQIEEFMVKLLEKLPEDEQTKVDRQIYYDTDKNSLSYMLETNGTSPHFWMYYPESGWGAVKCWIKKDGTMEGAIFHDSSIKPIQEFDNAGTFDGDLAEFVRIDLINAGRLTKLREGVDCYYVVNSPDDGDLHDTFAVKFENLKDAEKYRDTQENNFRERELLTENEFLATWTKPADAYSSEEEAAEDDCVWDDDYERWLEIPVDDWEK
ncbi:hypothetical protein EFM17_00665 [Lactobacillus delbrueckii]|nr:hypothetical protein [Lactobacillus delbrueckii]